VVVLNRALRRFPASGLLSYNRAAYLARDGQLDVAGQALERLVRDGLAHPLEVGRDPDFAALAESAAWSHLVAAPRLQAGVLGEEGAVLVGDLVTLKFAVFGPADSVLTVEPFDRRTGKLVHIRTVEDVTPINAWESTWTLEVVWRAVRPGQVILGPWRFAFEDGEALAGPVKVEILSLETSTSAEPVDSEAVPGVARADVWFPSSRLTGTPVPWIGTRGESSWIVSTPLQQIRLELDDNTEAASPVKVSVRRMGQDQWQAERWPLTGGATGRVLETSQVVLEARLP
jgi:hypothetical protein